MQTHLMHVTAGAKSQSNCKEAPVLICCAAPKQHLTFAQWDIFDSQFPAFHMCVALQTKNGLVHGFQ